jgi:hypothetical protein
MRRRLLLLLFATTVTPASAQMQMRAYRRERALGREHTEWLAWVKNYVDWLLQQQRSDGSFPRRWKAGSNEIEEPSGTTSYCPVPLLVMMTEQTGDARYRQAAIRAAEFVWSNSRSTTRCCSRRSRRGRERESRPAAVPSDGGRGGRGGDGRSHGRGGRVARRRHRHRSDGRRGVLGSSSLGRPGAGARVGGTRRRGGRLSGAGGLQMISGEKPAPTTSGRSGAATSRISRRGSSSRIRAVGIRGSSST